MRSFFLIPAILLIAWFPVYPASVSSPDQVVARGQAAAVPLLFSAEGQRVSAVQFDLAWDVGVDVKLVFGDRLRSSSKAIYTAQLASRSLRCIIAGGNDVLAFYFSTEVEALTVAFRVLAVGLPVLAWILTYRACVARQRSGGEVEPSEPRRPGGVALRRTASGGFEEVER